MRRVVKSPVSERESVMRGGWLYVIIVGKWFEGEEGGIVCFSGYFEICMLVEYRNRESSVQGYV